MRSAAFFDLDGTLLSVNSGRLWMERERRLGRITLRQLLQGTFYLVAYRLSVIDIEQVTIEALKTVQGEREQTVREWTRAWFVEEVAPHIAPGARPALEAHRAHGDLCVLLTSSSLYESEIATEMLGLDAFLCTRYEVQNGVFTGGVVRPVCYGEGKVALAERFAAQNGIDLLRSAFYSDSFSDLPMLRRVGRPGVVNPDLRLRLAARRQGWPVLDWRA